MQWQLIWSLPFNMQSFTKLNIYRLRCWFCQLLLYVLVLPVWQAVEGLKRWRGRQLGAYIISFWWLLLDWSRSQWWRIIFIIIGHFGVFRSFEKLLACLGWLLVLLGAVLLTADGFIDQVPKTYDTFQANIINEAHWCPGKLHRHCLVDIRSWATRGTCATSWICEESTHVNMEIRL